MNKQHQSFLLKCLSNFKKKFSEKFIKGCEEHEGNLFDLSVDDLLEEALQENYDQYCFLMAIKEKRKKEREGNMKQYLKEFRYHKEPRYYKYEKPPELEKYIPKIKPYIPTMN